MKLFISFFQSTCINTSCQDEFSEILINIMTSLNEFNPTYHSFFIHSFFFPLINAFQGIPLIFVWKGDQTYLKQVTDILKSYPIRSNSSVITHEEQFYHPIESVDESTLNHSLLFVEKQSGNIKYKLS